MNWTSSDGCVLYTLPYPEPFSIPSSSRPKVVQSRARQIIDNLFLNLCSAVKWRHCAFIVCFRNKSSSVACLCDIRSPTHWPVSLSGDWWRHTAETTLDQLPLVVRLPLPLSVPWATAVDSSDVARALSGHSSSRPRPPRNSRCTCNCRVALEISSLGTGASVRAAAAAKKKRHLNIGDVFTSKSETTSV